MQTNQTETYLFQMTIPSVQKFINASRKSSDLWAGSLIVSYIMKKLLNKVINKYKNERVGSKIQLIYPFTENYFNEKEITSNIPNIAIFMINCITEHEALELKKTTEKDFESLLEEIIKFEINKFFKEEIKDEDIRIAFNVKNIKNIKNKIEEIKKRENKYIDLAKYQIKNTLKFFIEYLPLDKIYKEVSEDLIDIVNYEKKSQLPKKAFIENYYLIKSPNWEEKGNWEDFFEEEKGNNFNSGFIQGVYRCSSCGEHTIIGAELEDWKGNNIWKPLWETNPKYFNRGERLCGVCLAKRYFRDYMRVKEGIEDESLGFPSTSEIAATLFKKEILKILKTNPNFNDSLRKITEALKNIPGIDNSLKEFRGNLTSKVKNELDEIFPLDKTLPKDKQCETYKLLNIDGEWFIEDTWKNENDYKVIGADEKKANQMLSLLNKIYSSLKSSGIEKYFKPSEYYAVILLDGDSIGEKLNIIKSLNNPIETHRNFSATLSELSSDFKNIVEDHYGALIYSGGDDVLALVPVEMALDCANEIQNKFRSTLSDKFPNIHNQNPFTMSGAIIYAHHKLPLSYILDEARKCEEKAKEEGKNRVCLKYTKKSLASAETVINWENIIDILDIIKIEGLDIPQTLSYDLIKVSQFSQIDLIQKDDLRENLLRSLLKNKVSKSQVDTFLDVFWKIDSNYKFEKIANTLKLLILMI